MMMKGQVMNFIDAINSGKIAIHPMMIGGWKKIDGKVYHRDSYEDFNYPEWVKEDCRPFNITMSGNEWDIMCDSNWKTL